MGKGVVFTLIFFLLGLTLLGLTLLILNLNQSTDNRALEFALANRVQDLSDSVSNGLKTLFLQYSDIFVYVNNNQIGFQETLTSNNTGNYVSGFNGFKYFIESKEPYVKIDNSSVGDLKLYLSPVNMNYYFDVNTSKIIINNFTNVSNITISVYKSNINIGGIIWRSVSNGSVSFTVLFKNDTSSLQQTKNIDLKQVLDLSLDSDGSGFGTADIDLNKQSNGVFEVKIFNGTSALYSTTLSFNNTSGLKVYLDRFVNVSIPEFNISKTSRPRIV